MASEIIHVGIDDTDSPEGGCTTFVGYIVCKTLIEYGARFVDYPNLVRLNPNIPWKTRGNAAVAIHVTNVSETDVLEAVEEAVKRYSSLTHAKPNPAVAILRGGYGGEVLAGIYRHALARVTSSEAVKRVLQEFRVPVKTLCFRGERGVVGAVAALGFYFYEGDYTYELLVYRDPNVRNRDRHVNALSVAVFDRASKGITFANIYRNRPLITPHGPDPVIFGVRGDSPHALVAALKIVRFYEDAVGWIIYRSNQGTGAHLWRKVRIREVRPYDEVVVEGRVVSKPSVIEGRHVKFTITDGTGEIEVVVYRETGKLRSIALKLEEGDVIEVGGGVRPASSKHGITLNAEYIRVVSVARKFKLMNPPCPRCGARMESAGRGKGMVCPKCGFSVRVKAKVMVEVPRSLQPGLYLPDVKAYRHLTRPSERLFLRKSYRPLLHPLWIR